MMTYINNKLLILIFALGLFSCSSTKDYSGTKKANISSSISDSLSLSLNNIIDKKDIVGFSAAIVNDDGILYNEGFGYSNILNNIKYTNKTIQNVSSLSQTLIGIALLKAQEMGKLKLDDPINKHLPFKVINPSHPEISITIRHLITETSSIKNNDIFDSKKYVYNKKEYINNRYMDSYPKTSFSQKSFSDFIESLLVPNGDLYFSNPFFREEPGHKVRHSSLGIALCALVIQYATKVPFDAFAKEHILDPLNMIDSGWSVQRVDSTRVSKLYSAYGKELQDYTIQSYPESGFLSTTNDLSKLLIELINGYNGKGTLLSETSFKELYKNQSLGNKDVRPGIFIEYSDDFKEDNIKTIGNFARQRGVMAVIYFNPITKIGKILISNSDSDSEKVIYQFKEIIDQLNLYSAKY